MKMAKRTTRTNSRELRIIKEYLLQNEGNICKICNVEFPTEKLIVEHKDNDFTNWQSDNIQLACQSCNISKNPPYRKKRDIDNSCACVSVFEEPKPQTAEMARNIKAEPLFRNWLNNEMTRKLRMELEDVINSGAELAGVSVDTIRGRYLKKLTSRLGPYSISEELGEKILIWKNTHFPFNNEIKKWTK